MPLIIPPAPAQSTEALRAAIPSMINRPALAKVAPKLSAAVTGPAEIASLSPTLSYRVFSLGLSSLAAAAGNNLQGATLSAWRHTLASDGEVVTADVSVDQAGTDHEFAALSANPGAPDVQNTINSLNRDPDVAQASYEVSLLQIPALAVRAVWLQDPSGKAADILVPVAPIRPELVAGRHYSAAEFVAALRDAAAKILADDDPRKGS